MNYTSSTYRKLIIRSFYYPVLFLVILWLIKIIEYVFKLSFSDYGLLPLHAKGLIGIITSPLIHGSFSHLLSNSAPLLVLGACIFYFYREIAFNIIFWIYLLTGLWVWFAGRTTHYHIGASGLVYGCAAFLLISGIIRRNRSLAAISLLIAFLYGGLFWGLFPIKEHVSWESHLMGFIAGVVMAVYTRNRAIDNTKQENIEKDEEEPVLDDFVYYSRTLDNSFINYYYSENKGE